MVADVRLVKKGYVESVLPMIAEKARATHAKLPLAEQAYISVQDLIAEGTNLAVTRAAKLWSPRRGAKFSTYLFKALDNHYTSVIRAAYSQGRSGARVYSLDTTVVQGTNLLLIDAVRRTHRVDHMEDKLILRIDAERGFMAAYSAASWNLRRYLIRWMLQPNKNKFKEGVKVAEAMQEFDLVALRYLTPDMCNFIQNDYLSRYGIANKIMSNFVTPGGGLQVATNVSQIIERELLPLMSADRRKSILAMVD